MWCDRAVARWSVTKRHQYLTGVDCFARTHALLPRGKGQLTLTVGAKKSAGRLRRLKVKIAGTNSGKKMTSGRQTSRSIFGDHGVGGTVRHSPPALLRRGGTGGEADKSNVTRRARMELSPGNVAFEELKCQKEESSISKVSNVGL
jgi:hypothetical protein